MKTGLSFWEFQILVRIFAKVSWVVKDEKCCLEKMSKFLISNMKTAKPMRPTLFLGFLTTHKIPEKVKKSSTEKIKIFNLNFFLGKSEIFLVYEEVKVTLKSNIKAIKKAEVYKFSLISKIYNISRR